jgi:sulfide:quinone oxidoreductase
MANTRIVILGAGFGGLELSAILSAELEGRAALTLIDRSASFTFGSGKLEYMFGRRGAGEILHPYAGLTRPGVRFLQDSVTGIDPVGRLVTTAGGRHPADIVVVALGADYDIAATPGLAESGNEFYSLAGVERLREKLPHFPGGKVIVGVCGKTFKCPPAPAEAAMMMHEYLLARGIRDRSAITLVVSTRDPVPPSASTSDALREAFRQRDIAFIGERRITALDGPRRAVLVDDGSALPYDLFLGIPEHVAPAVVAASGLAPSGWIKTGPAKETSFPGVFAIGDVTSAEHKSGVSAEAAARIAAAAIIARLNRTALPEAPAEGGSCHIEFAEGLVARFDHDHAAGSTAGRFHPPSPAIHAEKRDRNAERLARWFGS